MTYKTRQEVLRAAADWMDVCRAAGIVANVKHFGMIFPIQKMVFLDEPENYEFPLALLEGKEVWVGSELYDCLGHKLTFTRKEQFNNVNKPLSWNPPKPKTVMVELSREDAKWYSKKLEEEFWTLPRSIRIAEACKKALEKL